MTNILVLIVLVAANAIGQNQTPNQDKSPSAGAEDLELNTVLMESTFRIEGKNTQGQPTMGTAFVMGRPYPNQTPNQSQRARYVLITAAHVLEEMQGDMAILHLRRKTSATNWVRVPFPISVRSNGKPLWTKHPDADVGVMYIQIPNEVLIPILSTDLLADDKTLTEFGIHPGDNLECLGYPFGMEANDIGFPILRSGKIASYPLLPTEQTKTFLLDFLVFKGNSGGPVYMVESTRTFHNITQMGTIHFIAGLVTQERSYNEQLIGQYSAELHQYQLGLAVVVHASLIKQAINMLPSPEKLPD